MHDDWCWWRETTCRGRSNALLWLSLSSKILIFSKTKISEKEKRFLVSICIYAFSVHSVSEPWPDHVKCSFSNKLSPAADSSLAGIQFILPFSKDSLCNRAPRASSTKSNSSCWNAALPFLPLEEFCLSSTPDWHLLQQFCQG